jgi:hypothetical protein
MISRSGAVAEPLYTDADVELAVEALNPGRNADRDYYRRRAVVVLEALTAAGWRPPARPDTPDTVAEKVAQAARVRDLLARELGGRP